MTLRVAVLVDGDNVAAENADEIWSRGTNIGRVDIARVYADLRKTPKWLENQHFRPMHAGGAKNSADILLVIDAMEMALSQGVEAFVIASSDSDFTHIVRRLRELGRKVVGLGEAKTPTAFRTNCCEFVELTPSRSAPPCGLPPASKLDAKIRSVVALHDPHGKGLPIACLGNKIHADHGVCIKAHPDKSWRAYLEARPSLYDLDPRGPKAKVRLKSLT
jgi:uncharacterized protein (TIGR00288 family)